MLVKLSEITGEDIPHPRILSEEEFLAMRESLAQKHFGMSLASSQRFGKMASLMTTVSVTERLSLW